jgi:hypothetical protein
MQAHLSAERPALSTVRPEMGAAMDRVVTTGMARDPEDRYGSATALITAARAARPWTGIERRTQPPRAGAPPAARPTVLRPAAPPPAAPPPAPEPAPAAPAAPPRPRRAIPVVGAVAGLVLIAAAGALALGHRGGGGTAPPPTPAPLRGLAGALLTIDDFDPGTVTRATGTTDLDLAHVSCGAPPAGKVDERSVTFVTSDPNRHESYFDDAVSFSSDADAIAYMERLAAEAKRCAPPVRFDPEPAAPSLGDGIPVRVLFRSNSTATPFVYDALYIRHARVVSLIMVSRGGDQPPPASYAEAVAPRVLQHMKDSAA